MDAAALTNLSEFTDRTAAVAARRGEPVEDGAASFARELRGARGATPASGGGEDDRLRTAAEQLVASAFVLPLLQQMRDSPFQSELFGNTQGEKLFGQRLDTELADRIAASPNFPLVDTIVDRFSWKVDAHG